MAKKIKYTINNDAPCVNMEKDDFFERDVFVKTIVHFLALPLGASSQLIALNAPWGYGKTSVINFIKEELTSKKNYYILHFSPWLITNREQLIQSFLLQLAATFKQEQKTCKAADALVQYTLKLGPWAIAASSLFVDPSGVTATTVKGALDVGAKIKDITNNLINFNLEKAKIDVAEAIKNSRKQIVVIIDDIDRLPPEEIRTLMQLVKAVADFNNISYLLAFEEEPVIKALSYDELYDGRRYLEKIVHRAFHLPRLSWLNKYNLMKKRLEQVIYRNNLELSEEEQEILKLLLDKSTIVRILDTPRDINRLYSTILTTSFALKNEICFADIVAWEALQLKFPDITKNIKERPDILMGQYYFDENLVSDDHIRVYANIMTKSMSSQTDQDKTPSFKDQLVADLPTPRKQIEARNLLDFLFVHESKISRDPEYNISTRVSNRNHTKNVFAKLLFGGVTKDSISNAEIYKFYRNPDIREQILLSHYEDGILPSWISIAESTLVQESLEVIDINNLLETFISFNLRFPNDREINKKIAIILCHLYNSYDIEDKGKFASKRILSEKFESG